MTKHRRWPSRLDPLLYLLDSIAGRLGLRLTRTDFDLRHVPQWQRDIIATVEPFTGTDPLAVAGLIDAVTYLEKNAIPGAIVECGVWRGGSMMAAAYALLRSPPPERELYFYDTFEGMTRPSERDVRLRDGLSALVFHDSEVEHRDADKSDWFWVQADIDSVQANLKLTGYPKDLLQFIAGRVEDTIPETMPDAIALLRLDTDWYESTRHELEHLFQRLSPGGVLIVDDYHYWRGSRQAVDEYFELRGKSPLFSRLGSHTVISVF